MKLTEREHEVVVNVWGEKTPIDLSKVDTEELVMMHDRVSRAVQASYEDDGVDSLGILLPLEDKIIQVLHGRL